MAGDSVEIRIIATDGTAQVFRAIQQNADRLGRDLTDAGRDGDRAFDQIERGAKEADRALDQASRSARSFGDRMQGAAQGVDEFGEGLLVVGAGLTYAGNKAMEQERQIIALRAAYGDAAEGMIQFAEELDAVTIFDDEDIRAGERFFASLYNNYDLSIQQIQQLMRVTADLASASGVSFEDASNRVTAAIRGEGEAAEWLGLTMNQQSIDRENLTLSMSNQEAAQFRLNELLQQAAVYEGTATEMAQASVGTYAELTDTVNDAAGALGDFVGPVGSIVSGVGMMTVGLSGMVGGLGKLATVARTAASGMTALSAATAPMIAALGAGAIIGGGIGGFMGEFVNSLRDGESATRAFSDSTNVLAAAMGKLKDGDPVGFFRTLLFGIEDADSAMRSFNQTVGGLYEEAARQQVLGNTEVAEALEQLVGETDNVLRVSEEYINSQQFLDDVNAKASQGVVSYATAQQILTDAYTQSEAEARVYTEAVAALGAAMLDPANDAAEINARLDDLHAQFSRGELSLDQYREELVALAREYGTMPNDVGATNDAIQDTGSVVDFVNNKISGGIAGIREYREELNATMEAMAEHRRMEAEHATEAAQQQDDYWEQQRAQAEANHEANRQRQEERRRLDEEQQQRKIEHEEEAAQIQQTRWEEERARREEQRAADEAEHEARVQRARDFIATMREVSGFDSPLATLDMTSLSTDAMAFARYVQVGNSALENTFRIVVGNTNAMGQTVQATADWIDELAYAEDGWTRVHQLQADGFINEQQMNAVFEARTQILDANWHVQNDILTMQALQAPLMADLVSQQEAYIHALSNQSAEQQLVALGWMDSATAAQAYTITTQAAAVATGELGASGRAAFEDMVQGAIAMNPVLEQLLTDIGLVARDHHGNLIFNYDGMEQANSEIKMLTESILMLVDILDDNELNGSVSLDTLEAQQNADDLLNRLTDLDGTEATTRVEGDNSGALGAIQGAMGALLGLDGGTATTYQHGVPDDALADIGNVSAELAGLNGRTATVTINAIDNAGGVLGGVLNQILSLDGRTATSYVNTVNTTSYQTIGSPVSAFATGGTVWADQPSRWGMAPQAANGRTVLVGEVGPELVTLPHGSQVMPHAASMSRTGDTSGGISLHIDVHGNVYGVDDLVAEVGVPLMRMVAEETVRHRRAVGVI